MKPISSGSMNMQGESRYTVIVAAAKRARQILEGDPSTIKGDSTKPVTLALQEYNAGKLRWSRTKEGIK